MSHHNNLVYLGPKSKLLPKAQNKTRVSLFVSFIYQKTRKHHCGAVQPSLPSQKPKKFQFLRRYYSRSDYRRVYPKSKKKLKLFFAELIRVYFLLINYHYRYYHRFVKKFQWRRFRFSIKLRHRFQHLRTAASFRHRISSLRRRCTLVILR